MDEDGRRLLSSAESEGEPEAMSTAPSTDADFREVEHGETAPPPSNVRNIGTVSNRAPASPAPVTYSGDSPPYFPIETTNQRRPHNLLLANHSSAHNDAAATSGAETSPEVTPVKNFSRKNNFVANRMQHADYGNASANSPAAANQVGSAPQSANGHNWQAGKLSMSERLAFMFNNETLSDVRFIVGRSPSQQRIPAHKFILSIGSAVFDAMFNGQMAAASSEIELPDVEPAAAFMSLLKFLYTDEVHIGPETVMTTLYTAKKYAVPALESQCVDFLKRNLSSENAFLLLSQARLFDEAALGDLCVEQIDKHTTDAICAEGFVDIDLETLCMVLRRDTLSIRECKLFHALVRWSDAECQRQQIPSTPDNKRRVMGEACSLIRFPLMTVEEFAQCAQTKVLRDPEIVSIFLYFTVNPKPKVDFSDKPRCYLSGLEYTVNRFRHVDCRWGYSGTSDKIRFRVNQKIHIVGLALYGSTHLPTDYQVNVQVIDDDSGKICGENDTSFSSDGSTQTFRVMFKEPVEIRPHNYYTASATIAGADSHYGTKGMRKIVIDTPDGKIIFHFQHSPGNNNGTSVEDGQIPEFIFYT